MVRQTHYLCGMKQSTIQIRVDLNEHKIPEHIRWQASDSHLQDEQKAKALCLAFWDGADQTALRIDLWTNDMRVDEMGDFYFQMMMGMADTLQRSTGQETLCADMKTFANAFHQRFRNNLITKDESSPNT